MASFAAFWRILSEVSRWRAIPYRKLPRAPALVGHLSKSLGLGPAACEDVAYGWVPLVLKTLFVSKEKRAAQLAVPKSVFLINRAAGNDGAEDARLGELGGGNLGEIVRKDDEIGVFARLQLAFLPFLELRVGRS